MKETNEANIEVPPRPSLTSSALFAGANQSDHQSAQHSLCYSSLIHDYYLLILILLISPYYFLFQSTQLWPAIAQITLDLISCFLLYRENLSFRQQLKHVVSVQGSNIPPHRPLEVGRTNEANIEVPLSPSPDSSAMCVGANQRDHQPKKI